MNHNKPIYLPEKNFFKHLLAILGLSPDPFKSVSKRIVQQNVNSSLQSDWERIGCDFKKVVNQYQNDLNEQKLPKASAEGTGKAD